MNQKLIDLALEEIKEAVENQDLTAVEELLKSVPDKNLVALLGDDRLKEYKSISIKSSIPVIGHKMVISCKDEHGTPELAFVKMTSPYGRDRDLLDERARVWAQNNGYCECGAVYRCGSDAAGDKLEPLFDWDSASVVRVE